MMSKFIYKILWICLIAVAKFYEAIRWLFTYVKVKCKLIRKIYFNCVDGVPELRVLDECKGVLTKKPRHVCVVIGPNSNISPEVISKLAAYALICDIDFISFYDTKNEFTLDQIKIPTFVSSQRMSNGRFVWSMPFDKKRIGEMKYKNGLDKTIQVSSLSASDGHPLIAEVCRELWAKRKTDEIQALMKSKNDLADRISLTLQKKLNNLPNPDIVIIFDKVMCTYGLLPWHIGFSEFYHFENGEFFDVDDFVDILRTYSKCEQRFGK